MLDATLESAYGAQKGITRHVMKDSSTFVAVFLGHKSDAAIRTFQEGRKGSLPGPQSRASVGFELNLAESDGMGRQGGGSKVLTAPEHEVETKNGGIHQGTS